MEKYKVDYSESSHFKGITIAFDYLEKGINYAKKHKIKHILVRVEESDTKRVVNFDFLKDLDFIETFHWTVNLAKKSDITGLYHMSKLKDLRWSVENDFILNLSRFPLLEELNISDAEKFYGWEALKQLESLMFCGLKSDDLSFLKGVTSLKYFRVIRGSFTSIAGIENCSKLETLFLQNCRFLTELQPTIMKLQNLKRLELERCNKVDPKEQFKGVNGEYIIYNLKQHVPN